MWLESRFRTRTRGFLKSKSRLDEDSLRYSAARVCVDIGTMSLMSLGIMPERKGIMYLGQLDCNGTRYTMGPEPNMMRPQMHLGVLL